MSKRILLEGFVSDYDGTLADTLPRQFLWFQTWAKMNDIGWKKISFEDFAIRYNLAIDRGGFEEAYKEFGLPCDLVERPCTVWLGYNNFKMENPTTFHDGIPEMIKDLHEMFIIPDYMNRRIRMGINTSNDWPSIENELKLAGLTGYIDSRVTARELGLYDDYGRAKSLLKPNKVSTDMTLSALDSKGFRTIFLGDTIKDLRSAKNVPRKGNYIDRESLIVFGAGWGYEGREKLEKGTMIQGEKFMFDEIFDHPSEIVPAVKKYLD